MTKLIIARAGFLPVLLPGRFFSLFRCYDDFCLINKPSISCSNLWELSYDVWSLLTERYWRSTRPEVKGQRWKVSVYVCAWFSTLFYKLIRLCILCRTQCYLVSCCRMPRVTYLAARRMLVQHNKMGRKVRLVRLHRACTLERLVTLVFIYYSFFCRRAFISVY